MTEYRLAVLTGDGIGPEVVPPACALVDAVTETTGTSVRWVPLPMGWEAIEDGGDPLPASTRHELSSCPGWIVGPHDSASYPEQWQASGRIAPGGELRRIFGLYANIRPARTFPGVPSQVPGTDLVILRENSEGFYADRNLWRGHGELMPTRDVALAIGVFTRPAVERIVTAGFELAQRRRGHLTVVHKANVLAETTGMFRSIARDLAGRYPDVRLDDVHVDAMAALLVRRPQSFDVVVTENMFGDILSDLAGELVGGLGLAAALNAGAEHAMAQAVHGSAPDLAGKDQANPVGEMLSAMMLLRWLGDRHHDPALARAADLGERAVERCLESGVRTADLGGQAGTAEFSQAVLAAVGS